MARAVAAPSVNLLLASATPHNGYQSSYTALLEILDPRRFVRGMAPDEEREVHALLTTFAEVRRARLRATDLITLLLKKQCRRRTQCA